MVDIKSLKPSKRYAIALFETIQDKDFNKISKELELFIENLRENSEFRNFIFHPIINLANKKEAVREIFKNFSKETLDFIFILLDEKRIDCLEAIKSFLDEKINEKTHVINADVTLAINPNSDMQNYIKQRLEAKLNSSVNINFLFDEEIIGGMLIKIKDTVVDLSIKKKMENFKQI